MRTSTPSLSSPSHAVTAQERTRVDFPQKFNSKLFKLKHHVYTRFSNVEVRNIFVDKQCEIPRSSATSWAHWASVSGHTPLSSSPLWKGQRAQGHSRAAGTPHGYLQYTKEKPSHSLVSWSSPLD